MLLEALLRLGSGPTSQPEAHPIFIWHGRNRFTIQLFVGTLKWWSKPFHLMGRRFWVQKVKIKQKDQTTMSRVELGDSTLISNIPYKLRFGADSIPGKISPISESMIIWWRLRSVLSSYNHTTGKCLFIQCGTLRKIATTPQMFIKQPYRNFRLWIAQLISTDTTTLQCREISSGSKMADRKSVV